MGKDGGMEQWREGREALCLPYPSNLFQIETYKVLVVAPV